MKNDSSPATFFCGGRLKEWDSGLVYGVLAADTKLGSLPEFEVQFEDVMIFFNTFFTFVGRDFLHLVGPLWPAAGCSIFCCRCCVC